jgi:hypothetical protein
MNRLTEAHILGQQRLRETLVRAVARVWASLAGYDRKDVPAFLAVVVPLVLAAQRQSASLTDAYLARALDRRPVGIDFEQVIGAAVRGGTSPETVYERPFITTWTGLKDGKLFEDAYADGLDRATTAAATDVQLAMRATAAKVQDADGLFGFARRADADACPFCKLLDGAYVKRADAFPMHPHCGCGLEPLTEPHPGAVKLPDGTRIREYQGGPLVATPLPEGVAVHEHGELGPVLTDPEHHFTGEEALV